MSIDTWRNYSGTAASLYQEFFVPTIATPALGDLLRAAELRPGQRVLDVACGTGVVARSAAERVGPTGAVTGIDLAPDMIAVAESTPAAGAPITWQQGDAQALPLPDAFYDVALCQMGVMFMADRDAALREMRRVVAPDGRVVISTPGPMQAVFAAMEAAIADHLGQDFGRFVTAVFSMPDPAVLGHLLTTAGLTAVETADPTVTLDLPGPVEFLWKYINLSPLGQMVAGVPDDIKSAMERQFVDACAPLIVAGRLPVEQPIALAAATRP